MALHRILAGTAIVFSPISASAVQDADAAPVGSTERFVFYSRFAVNLNDALIRANTDAADAKPTCLAGLPDGDREDWEWAVQRYRDISGAADGRRKALVARFHIVGSGAEVLEELGPMPPDVAEAMDAGAAAYRACWWQDDDEANRTWIAALLPLLRVLEGEVAALLETAYQTPFDTTVIAVDVVRRAGFGGANTIVEPHHILISSADAGYRGWAALEMIFHEASHTIIGRDRGEPNRQINATAERLGLEVPRELSHVTLFYTTGEVVRELRRERFGENYLPYLYARGLFEHAWPDFRAPMETWWKPYLMGEIDMAAAAEGVLLALR